MTFSPRGKKSMDPKSQRATIVLLYLGNRIIPLLRVMLSSSNIITTEYEEFNRANSCSNKKPFFTVPSNPWSFRTKRWKSTNGGNDQVDVHRLTSLMFSAALCSRGPCVFVAQHVIGSRPIQLDTMLPRYNKCTGTHMYIHVWVKPKT